MKLLNSASYASARRGYDYVIGNHVLYIEMIDHTSYNGLVKGNRKEPYKVHIDVEHIKKSKCECPFTEGNYKICKHMVAVFFTVFPSELIKYEVEVVEEEKRFEEYKIEREKRFNQFINGLKKQELRNILVELLEIGPDWQYDQFIEDYVDSGDDFNE